jgi:hypothetical protein
VITAAYRRYDSRQAGARDFRRNSTIQLSDLERLDARFVAVEYGAKA